MRQPRSRRIHGESREDQDGRERSATLKASIGGLSVGPVGSSLLAVASYRPTGPATANSEQASSHVTFVTYQFTRSIN